MSFSPDKDIPDLSGKVILVTGGNTGLGKETILQLAKHSPQQLIMSARNKSKATEAIEDIKKTVPNANITFLETDVASFSSVKKAAEALNEQTNRLDILINNAGIAGVDPRLTEDGYEMQFGTNHMGPALLTRLLMPLLERTAALTGSDVRIIQLSSDAHKFTSKEGISFSHLKDPSHDLSGTVRYAQSKLANLYFIKSLAKRHPNIMCVSLHPGVVHTNIFSTIHTKGGLYSWLVSMMTGLLGVNVQTGALGQLWAATGKREELVSGAFYMPLKKETKKGKFVSDDVLAEKLWEWTEKELDAKGF
jgi:NAD(P)-dependent dehydrogenase (short-subunit alcohol dehydrogenase family)